MKDDYASAAGVWLFPSPYESFDPKKPTKVTALQKLISLVAPHLSGDWELCDSWTDGCLGGLFGHAGYTECLPHWRIRAHQRIQTPSKAPCHTDIPRERHVCDGLWFLLFRHT